MKKLMISSVLIGLGSYVIYKAYYKIGNMFSNLNDFLPDDCVGNMIVLATPTLIWKKVCS